MATSYQVGGACYVSAIDAANAACAAYQPVAALREGSIRHSSCAGVSEAGHLVINVVDSPLDGSANTYTQVQAEQWFMPCQEQVKWDAYMLVFGAVLTCVGVCFAFWKVYAFFTSQTRVPE
jgi:hypothetical protein